MRAMLVLLLLSAAPAAADSSTAPSFGSVQNTPIVWEPQADVELSPEALRFTQPGTQARSGPLPLKPQHYYRIHIKMARGPGSAIQFAISYLDADNEPREWRPNWQFERATHPNWLPFSPHPQHYVQGFVLPLGATQPRLQLGLGKADKAQNRWELTKLSIEEASAAASCKKLSADRLLGGDFEGSPQDGLPAFWVQSSRSEDNRVELVDTQTACRHVLRVKPQTRVFVSSSYLVPVSPGSVYQISVRARGHGRILLDAHSLSRDRPNPQRVGNATLGKRGVPGFDIDSDTWMQLEQPWFAEAPNMASAQVMIDVYAHSAVDIDAVELRACEALSSP